MLYSTSLYFYILISFIYTDIHTNYTDIYDLLYLDADNLSFSEEIFGMISTLATQATGLEPTEGHLIVSQHPAVDPYSPSLKSRSKWHMVI